MVTYRPHVLAVVALSCTVYAFGQIPPSSTVGRESVRLSSTVYPEGVPDEDAYARWIKHRGEQLAALAERNADENLRRRYRIAAINWALARQCEPGLSRLLHAIPQPDDASEILNVVHSCLPQLKTMRESIRSDPPPASDDAGAPHQEEGEGDADDPADDESGVGDEISLADAVDMLTVFARAIEAVVSDPDDVGPERLDSAALDLSFYLEDERPDVASAALLWQAYLYAHAGKTQRAMRLLPRVMSPPRSGALMHDCLARLLRCRYMIQRGSYSAAWALLLAFEERSLDWFESPRDRADAARSAIFLKLSICDRWPSDARETERERTTSWCESAAKEILEEHFSDAASATLLRLQSAIPLVIEVPDELLPALDGPQPDARADGTDSD